MRQKFNAVITIYLSITFACIMSLILVLIESSRIRGAYLYYQYASDNSIDSMMSLYHLPLWDRYRIFGIEYNEKKMLVDEYKEFLLKHIENENGRVTNYYNADLDDDIKINLKNVLEGYSFENEIADYMKYAICGSMIDFGDNSYNILDDSVVDILAEDVSETSKELFSKEVAITTYKQYEIDHNLFIQLDDIVTNINDKINSFNTFIKKIIKDVKNLNTSQGITDIKYTQNLYKNMIDLSTLYYTTFDDLQNKVNCNIEKFSAEKSEYREDEIIIIENQLNTYKNYFTNDNVLKIYDDINNRKDLMQKATDVLTDLSDALEMYEISLIEANDIEDLDERREYKKQIKEEFDEIFDGFVDELEALYIEPIMELNSNVNKKLTKKLDEINKSISNELLKFVLPKNYEIPEKGLGESDKTVDSNLNFIDKFLYTEYIFSFFDFYLRNTFQKNELYNNSGLFETEYMITGKKNNKEALSNILYRIFSIRQILNMIHICTSEEKMNTVLEQTSIICSNPALESVFSILYITIWAMLQSVYDIKTLCYGKKVPMLHSNETWKIDGNYIFENGLELLDEEPDGEKGFSYRDYLRMFIFVMDEKTLNSRCAYVIENNLKQDENEFNFNNVAYSLHFDNKFKLKPLMVLFKMFDNLNNKALTGYDIEIDCYQSYKGNNRYDNE